MIRITKIFQFIIISILLFPLAIGMVCAQEESNSKRLYEIEYSIKKARRNADFGKLADAYYERALILIDEVYRADYVLDDLKQSAVYYRYKKDTLGYYKTRLVLADVYIRSNEFSEEASQILEDAISYFQLNGLDKERSKALSLLSLAYENQQDYEKALESVNKALVLNEIYSDSLLRVDNRIIISRLMGSLSFVEDAIDIGKENYANAITFADKNTLALILHDIGVLYHKIDNNLLSLDYLNRADSLVVKHSLQDIANQKQFARLYSEKGDFLHAFLHQLRYNTLKDSLFEAQKIDQVTRFQVEFQAAESENQILRLQQEQQLKEVKLSEKNRLLIVLTLGVLASIIAIFYIIRYYSDRIKINELLSKQRQKFDVQKINELKNDIKIKGLESMVEGQEVERNRIANELHDSLGGALSALKLQFDALQYDHSDLKQDSDYIYMNNQIDEACGEVRNIARNLNPSSLRSVGIKAAIQDLINRFKDSRIDISFYTENVEGVLKKESQLHLYRIIQELLNNAYRHARCSEIDIQLTRNDKEIILKVEDDGIGFDISTVKKGIGLESVNSRVGVLFGELNIDTKINDGTSIVIHIPISPYNT